MIPLAPHLDALHEEGLDVVDSMGVISLEAQPIMTPSGPYLVILRWEGLKVVMGWISLDAQSEMKPLPHTSSVSLKKV